MREQEKAANESMHIIHFQVILFSNHQKLRKMA